MLLDLGAISLQLQHKWSSIGLNALRARGSLAVLVAQALLLALLLDYSRMLWLRSKMVYPPLGYPTVIKARNLTRPNL